MAAGKLAGQRWASDCWKDKAVAKTDNSGMKIFDKQKHKRVLQEGDVESWKRASERWVIEGGAVEDMIYPRKQNCEQQEEDGIEQVCVWVCVCVGVCGGETISRLKGARAAGKERNEGYRKCQSVVGSRGKTWSS